MFKVGEKYKIYRSGAIELKDKKWVRVVVEHIPEHERFVCFRLHFTTCFGERTSYIESFTMNELTEIRNVKRYIKYQLLLQIQSIKNLHINV